MVFWGVFFFKFQVKTSKDTSVDGIPRGLATTCVRRRARGFGSRPHPFRLCCIFLIRNVSSQLFLQNVPADVSKESPTTTFSKATLHVYG
jgi:hypothetical protein